MVTLTKYAEKYPNYFLACGEAGVHLYSRNGRHWNVSGPSGLVGRLHVLCLTDSREAWRASYRWARLLSRV